MSYQTLFSTLWEDYIKRNPHAEKVHHLLTKEGETIQNDHIAFRTFNHPKINIDQLARFFIAYGYEEKEKYDFPIKKLFAKHYEHEDPLAPKVFISELLTEQFSLELQATVNACIQQIPADALYSEEFLTAGTFWQPLSYTLYKKLLTESEYAAWMYAFGFCANHFTVNINQFHTLKEINELNSFLIKNQFTLNTSGGLVKGTPQDYLEQSSTMAEEVSVKFIEGTYNIPSCYYEFAKRYAQPNGKLYSGFVAKSADKIFESTDVGRKNK
ncbi:MAG: hypothetical protein ACD_60C00090G0007 [uncultured bacterium]|nr:MAG: hypothetical protein ACD_60C00090G0007 [uncultured bacterium]